ncbi:MAG: hypothetical protein ACXVKT_06300 [Flavisolibacter sp.]
MESNKNQRNQQTDQRDQKNKDQTAQTSSGRQDVSGKSHLTGSGGRQEQHPGHTGANRESLNPGKSHSDRNKERL